MSEGPKRLRMTGVTREFSARAGVRDLSLEVAAGEIVCLLGPSGCGKTTTLRIAAGVERAESGVVEIDGMVMQAKGRFVPPEKRGVGLIFQDFALFPHLSVIENVMFGLAGRTSRERQLRAAEALAHVGLSGRAKAYPHVLSGGEQQRVALARALAPEPKLMLMDEPFSGLDERLREDIRDQTLNLLREAGAGALFVTHDPVEAMLSADRIAVMRAGCIVQIAKPDEIYGAPADPETAAFFSEHQTLDGVVKDGQCVTRAGSVPTRLAEGTAAVALVRPEAVLLDDAPGSIHATVTRSRMAGADHLIDLAIASGPDLAPLPLRAATRQDHPPRAGATVTIRLHPGKTLVFPAKKH